MSDSDRVGDVTTRTPERWSIKEAAKLLKISNATIYRRIAAGELHTVRDGGRVFVLDEEITRYARRG